MQTVTEIFFDAEWLDISGNITPHMALFLTKHLKFLKLQGVDVMSFIFTANLKEYLLSSENIDVFLELLKSPDATNELKISLLKMFFECPDFLKMTYQIKNMEMKNMSNLSEMELKDYFIETLFQKQDDWIENARILIELNRKSGLEENWVIEPLLKDLKNGFSNRTNFFKIDFYTLVHKYKNEMIVEDIFVMLNEFLMTDAHLVKRLSAFNHTFPLTRFLDLKKIGLFNGYLIFIIFNWKSMVNTLQKNEFFFRRDIEELSLFPHSVSDKVVRILLNSITQKNMTFLRLDWLYSGLSSIVFKADLKQSHQGDEIFLKKIIDYLPEFYKNGLLSFSQMIFSDIPGQSHKTGDVLDRTSPIEAIIYNQIGYDGEFNFLESRIYKKGSPLALNHDTPIGYNIYFPTNKIKAILVKVYGGDEAKDRIDRLSIPGCVSSFDCALLSQGIVVVTLNLIDLIRLKVFAAKMPKSLHDTLHASINLFAQKIKQDPTNFAPSIDPSQIPLLASLQGKPIYLYGASFGGRTTIRQAEMYPNSFDGYISHNGALSYKMGALSDLESITHRNKGVVEHINPLHDEKIKKITKSLLILHNFDDNNVNIKQSIDFVKNTKRILGEKFPLQVIFTDRGNAIPSEKNDIHNKGHYLPTSKETFDLYSDTIVRFMVEGGSKLPKMSEWRTHTYNIYANKNYRSATLKQKFISEAFRLYHSASSSANQFSPASIQFGSLKQREEAWKKYYEPLYIAMAYVNELQSDSNKFGKEITRLEHLGIITDEAINRALTKQLPLFFDYLNEYEEIYIPSKIIISEFLSPELREVYKTLLVNSDMKLSLFLLNGLYIANPELVSSFRSNYLSHEIRKGIGDVKKSFFKAISKEKEIAIGVWQQLVDRIRIQAFVSNKKG